MVNNAIRNETVDAEIAGMRELRIGEIRDDETLVVYMGGDATEANGISKLHNIDDCRQYRTDRCVCSSKIHYEIDGSVLCTREMKPFIYINRMSILYTQRKRIESEDLS